MKLKNLIFSLMAVSAVSVSAQTKLSLNLNKATTDVSPTLYGLMTEEINYSYEGGLYAQLIRNPAFNETTERLEAFRPIPTKPKYWELSDTINSTITVDRDNALNSAIKTSLRLEAKKSGTEIINRGFWGFPIRKNTVFNGTLYAKSETPQSLSITLESNDGKTIYAKATVNSITKDWQKYTFILTTDKKVSTTKDAVFRIKFNNAGTCFLTRVTLFPPTYNNRTNGLRQDLMGMMKDMHPKFLRFPGGNYLEGGKFSERFNWKNTIGNPDERPGHASPWGYWSTDGMGLLEFMQWAEDTGAEPLLAVFAGYTLNGDYVEGETLKPFIQDALDEIEYVIGGADTKWGAQRIKDGHPQPFPLHYVEIGNEDFFDLNGSYPHRYQQFYNAIKAKYPQLQLISTVDAVALRKNAAKPEDIKIDVIDEHYYRNADEMYRKAFQYDTYDRKGPKIFCGEWATREGKPTTNMNAALGDAAWMTGMERNSDILVASCYAPLFVNVNNGGMQWESDLIGYDALNAYGSPSYYAQVLFGKYLGNKIIPVKAEGIPTFKLTDKQGETVPQIYYTATKDTKTGNIYIKLVNATGNSNDISISLEGAGKINNKATKIELKADKPDATNSIDNPKNIIPVKSQIKVSDNFKLCLAPYSITIISM